MYQYNLVINIFSKDGNLEKIMKDITPESQFTHEVRTYEERNEEAIKNSDNLIWDFPMEELIEIKDNLKEYAKVVVCGNKYQQEFRSFDEILLKPFDENYTKHIIEELLYQIKLEEDLRDMKNRFDTAMDSIPDMYWEKDLNGIHHNVNQAFCEVVGKEKEDVEGKDHYYIWNVSKEDPNSGADICAQTEKMVIAKGSTRSFTESVKTEDERKQLTTYKSPIYDRNGNVVGTIGFGRDITNYENKSIENRILLDSVPYSVLIKDSKGKIINANKYFLNCFGTNMKSIENMQYDDWTEKTFQTGRTTNTEGYIEGITYSINGEEKQFELRSNDITDVFGNKTGEVCTFREVTRERKLEKENIEKSYTDQLTKLYNRQFLEEFISKQPDYMMLTLISMDLDNFKKVNDTYGHQVGDEALKLIANTLKEHFPNDVAIRMGGDEFLVMKVGNYSTEQVEIETQTFLNNLSAQFAGVDEFSNLPTEDGDITNLSASAGITQGFLALDSFDVLYKQSDDALYEAKKAGKACYQVHHEKKSSFMKKYLP